MEPLGSTLSAGKPKVNSGAAQRRSWPRRGGAQGCAPYIPVIVRVTLAVAPLFCGHVGFPLGFAMKRRVRPRTSNRGKPK